MIKICALIFFARIFDVSLGTIRTVYTVKGKELWAAIFAFMEVLVWFYVAKSALTSTNNSLVIALFYSLGYAFGTFIGTFLTRNFGKNYQTVRIILNDGNSKFTEYLKKENFYKNVYEIKNNIYYLDILKKDSKKLKKIVLSYDKKAKIIAGDIKYL